MLKFLAVSLSLTLLLASLSVVAPVLSSAQAQAPTYCDTLAKPMRIVGVNAAGYQGANVPANAIDGNARTRWSDNGQTWLNLMLESPATICTVTVSFYKDTIRTETYALYALPTSGISFVPLTLPTNASMIRFEGSGNNLDSWNSITEIKVTGYEVGTVPSAPVPSADPLGVKKIYPDASKPKTWYVDMEDPTSDPMLRNWRNVDFTKDPSGAWQVYSDQIRLEAWSPVNDKWLNVEITAYVKMLEGSNELIQLYSRGGHHTSSNECLGSAYKARLYGSGRAAWVKEVTHPAYAGNKGSVQATGDLSNKWVGFKAVIYNAVEPDTGKDYVRLESYIDDQADKNGQLSISNNWKLASVYDDKGGWRTDDADFDADCGRTRDQILLDAGGTSTQNIAAFRSDDLRWLFGYLSVREITPPASVEG